MSAQALNDISKWQRSEHDCPACSRKLWTLQLEDSRIWWCGVGPCPSLAANNGAPSIELLRKNVALEELEPKEDGEWP